MHPTKGLERRLFFCHTHQCICIYGFSFFFFVGQWVFFFLFVPSPFLMGAFSFIYFGKVSSFQVVLGVSIIMGRLVRDLYN